MLTDFQNFFTDVFCRQLGIKWLLNMPPTNCVATLWNINARKTNNNRQHMLVNKIHFSPKMRWTISTMPHFVISVSLDIWHVKRCVCFWCLWFSKPTISFTVVTFSLVRAFFSLLVSSHAFGRCMLQVSQISVNNIPSICLLQLIFKNSASIFQSTLCF